MGTISPPSQPRLHSPQNLKAPHLVPPPSNHHQPTSVTPTFPIWHQLWLCWIILSEGFYTRRLFLKKSNHLAKWNWVLSAMMNNTELNDDDVELILILVIVSMIILVTLIKTMIFLFLVMTNMIKTMMIGMKITVTRVMTTLDWSLGLANGLFTPSTHTTHNHHHCCRRQHHYHRPRHHTWDQQPSRHHVVATTS